MTKIDLLTMATAVPVVSTVSMAMMAMASIEMRSQRLLLSDQKCETTCVDRTLAGMFSAFPIDISWRQPISSFCASLFSISSLSFAPVSW